METKRCTGCLKTKPVEEFYKQSMGRKGCTSRCKECSRADYHNKRASEAEAIPPQIDKTLCLQFLRG